MELRTDPLDDHFHDACGVFGVYNHPEAANLVYLGLYALQHRGQESAGIVSAHERILHINRGRGLVADVFKQQDMERLCGTQAIGHVRYSTAGGSANQRNLQPLVVDTAVGGMAIAHNGNLVNALTMRRRLEERGSIFQSTMDTEVIVHLTALSRRTSFSERLIDALEQVKGAYSLVAMNEGCIIGVRDPNGFRPLALGRLRDQGYVISSETCAMDLIDAEFVRDIEPGEMIVIDGDGLHSSFPFGRENRHLCIFEFIYFARPDSSIDGVNVYEARKRIGARLAQEQPVKAEVVIPVPDSGVPAALGFAYASDICFELGIIRNHYVGRTFIEPQQSIRNFGVKIKLNSTPEVIAGKRVVLIDDSVVRGTTSRKIVKMVRDAGAREVHVRIASPPTCYPCYYGIDTPTRRELLAANHSVDEMRAYIGADSLAFISIKGLYQAVNGLGGYCDACFSGRYPVPLSVGEDASGCVTLLKEG
ncbi:MAG: amidophosphoribosyltransferase [Magnetococcales bacterium]|nr:amidophosphoribosyltransferase [Magnetococcales bacterium]